MSRRPLNAHRARLHAACELLTGQGQRPAGGVFASLPVAWALLEQCQPGYPTGGEPPSAATETDEDGNPTAAAIAYSDRTGQLATHGRDIARRDLDDLSRLLDRITADVVSLADIVRRWQPPGRKWREALATEAAERFTDTDCRSCLRVGVYAPRRPEGGDLCRWCSDWKRELGRSGDLPVWFVERHAQGRRITATDVDRAKREMRKR